MTEKRTTVRYRVTGRVQGVGFRWWTKSTADALGVGGSVRNLPDGSVEVHASGDGVALGELERLLHEGPRFSRVDEVVLVDRGEVDPDGAGGRGDFVILG